MHRVAIYFCEQCYQTQIELPKVSHDIIEHQIGSNTWNLNYIVISKSAKSPYITKNSEFWKEAGLVNVNSILAILELDDRAINISHCKIIWYLQAL